MARRGSFLAGTVGLLLLCADTTRAAGPPDLSGAWKLNHQLSDDAEAKVKDAAGSEYIQGGPSWAAETIFPWGRKFNEDERVLFRDVLLAAMRGLERIEVDQTPSEIKTIHGQDGVRVFYLTRAAAGTNLVTGEKVKRSAHWKGDQLVLESTGGKGKAREVLSLVPARNQLIHALHLEMDLLKRPIDLRLVYDRIPVASFAPGK
jgi:hypothetical protein